MDRFALQRPFTCDCNGCDAKFESSRELRLHVAVHNWGPHSVSTDPVTGQTVFRCLYEGCDREVTDRKVLRKHLLTHRPRQFQCEYPGCEKRFYERAKLKRHYLVHSGEKEFVCSVKNCGKSFAYKANLKTHMRTHSGERPFACTFPGCKKRFAQASNRNSHVLIHTRNKANGKNTTPTKGTMTTPKATPDSSSSAMSHTSSSTASSRKRKTSESSSPGLGALRISAGVTRPRQNTSGSLEDLSPNSSTSTPQQTGLNPNMGAQLPNMSLDKNTLVSPKRRDTVNSLLFLSAGYQGPNAPASAAWPGNPASLAHLGNPPFGQHAGAMPQWGPPHHFAPAVGSEMGKALPPHPNMRPQFGHMLMPHMFSNPAAFANQQFPPPAMPMAYQNNPQMHAQMAAFYGQYGQPPPTFAGPQGNVQQMMTSANVPNSGQIQAKLNGVGEQAMAQTASPGGAKCESSSHSGATSARVET